MNARTAIETGGIIIAMITGLRASVHTIDSTDIAMANSKGRIPIFQTNPLTNAQLMRPDHSQHENECSTDAECNPGIADFTRFTRSCQPAELPAEGGNQGKTCTP